jgi:hypothetical protein
MLRILQTLTTGAAPATTDAWCTCCACGVLSLLLLLQAHLLGQLLQCALLCELATLLRHHLDSNLQWQHAVVTRNNS